MSIFDDLRTKQERIKVVIDLAAFVWSHSDRIHDALVANRNDLVAAEFANRVRKVEESK